MTAARIRSGLTALAVGAGAAAAVTVLGLLADARGAVVEPVTAAAVAEVLAPMCPALVVAE